MSSPRYWHTATLLPNGKVLVTGGNQPALFSAEIYDPGTGSWTNTGSMSSPRVLHTATLLSNGKVLVTGGFSSSPNGIITLSSAELYDPDTGAWTSIGSLSSARYRHTASLLSNGKVLVAGGWGVGGISPLSSAELYDPHVGIWATTGSMNNTRGNSTATLLTNGKVLVVGGYNAIFSVELYDPVSGTWTATGSLSQGRSDHTTVLLTNGSVLCVGGYNNGNLSTAELYNPVAGTWAATGSLNNARQSPASIVLPNSKVMVVGGYDNGSLSIVELYDRGSLAITLSEAANGTITGNTSPYPANEIATLTAIPSPSYVFIGWTGDANGSANPLSVLMNSHKTIGATFGPDLSDSDGDGLSAYEEAVTYGSNPLLSDSDGDGLTDEWEVGRGSFSIIDGSFTWSQARVDAQARGGDLACFATAARWNRCLEILGANALDNHTGLWIGASDALVEGTWTWVNGEPFTFSEWATTRPRDVAGNNLDYAEVSGGSGAEIGKWYDRSSALIRDGYIIEKRTAYVTDPAKSDTDGDGLSDSTEQTAGTNPVLADTDGDGLSDGQETNLTHTNPKLFDTDDNGTNDAQEDSDTDGLSNLAEINQYGTDPLDDDSDNDGLKDGVEVNYAASFYKLVLGSFTYPQAAADAASKRGRVASFPDASKYSRTAYKARQSTQSYVWIGLSDAASEGVWVWTDGSTTTYNRWLDGEPSGGATENHVVIMQNSTEWADTLETFVAAGYLFERVGLDPLDPDTDADGLSDGQEINTTNSSPVLDDTDGDGLLDGAEVNTLGSNPLLADTDEDGLSDQVEVEVYGSNPSLKDSDGDGFDDLFEVNTGFNPALATSTPDALSSIRTAVEFRFNAANGVSYRIEASTDLNQWDVIEPIIIGQSAVVTRFYSIENQPRRHFRVRRN